MLLQEVTDNFPLAAKDALANGTRESRTRMRSVRMLLEVLRVRKRLGAARASMRSLTAGRVHTLYVYAQREQLLEAHGTHAALERLRVTVHVLDVLRQIRARCE